MGIRLNSPYWRRVCAATSNLLFFVGIIVLLFVAAADFSVGLSCRYLDQKACVEVLGDSQLLLATAEGGGDIQMMPQDR